MKTFKLFNMAMLCLAITFVSCSGEDGKDGLPGVDGVDGVDGTQGAQGSSGISCWDLNGNGMGDVEEDTNSDGNFDALDCQGIDGADGEQGPQGEDGNANVVFTDYDMSNFSGNSFNVNPELSDEEIRGSAFFYYINTGISWYSIPGPLQANTIYARIFLLEIGGGGIYINFYNTSDDTPFDVPVSTYDFLRVVRIELGGFGKNSEKSVMAELKKAGVDTNDYYAVAAYFGLK